MSLINEALKKAQRLRTEDPVGDGPPMPGGGTKITKRGKARNANTMVLIASGGIVLVVLSVIATVFLLNRPSPPAATATTATPTPAKPPVEPASSGPAIVPPTITLPAPTPPVEPAASTTPAAVASAPPTKAGITPAVPPGPIETASTTPAATVPAPAPTPSTTPAVAKPDDRVTAFVEAVRVTGIRSSGADSRVLMNDRVYRVNDIVDRTLSVKLVKVAVDSLTFADANGVTYVKYF